MLCCTKRKVQRPRLQRQPCLLGNAVRNVAAQHARLHGAGPLPAFTKICCYWVNRNTPVSVRQVRYAVQTWLHKNNRLLWDSECSGCCVFPGQTAEIILRNNPQSSAAEMVLEPLLRERVRSLMHYSSGLKSGPSCSPLSPCCCDPFFTNAEFWHFWRSSKRGAEEPGQRLRTVKTGFHPSRRRDAQRGKSDEG